MEKAFDSVNHLSQLTFLENFELGKTFVSEMKLLLK